MTKTFIPYTTVILAVFLLSNLNATDQVTNYPYTQDFQEKFELGAAFLPYWKGNRMDEDAMGQYFDDEGNGALYMIPEGEEMTTIAFLYLDLSGKEHTFMDFTVATVKNGEDEDRKRTKLSVAISTDGGQTFGFGMKIGPEMGFENTDAQFPTFTYPFPPTAANQPNVVIRFQGKAGGGPHLAAILHRSVHRSTGPARPPRPRRPGGWLSEYL